MCVEEAALEVKQSTVAAVEAGDLSNLDLGSLLGEALSTLSAEMGLDIRGELAADPSQMQVAMQDSVSDLAASMRELDNRSQELYERLRVLETELRDETDAFDERKELELGDLLDDQNRLRRELAVSQASMKQSAAKLDALLDSYERTADPMTALAMFPLKSQDKKIAFVVGLALTLKVPYDLSLLVATRSLEGDALFSLFTQAVLAFTCMYHYGLIQAFLRSRS